MSGVAINFLVTAKNEQDAKDLAESQAERVVDGCIFDYVQSDNDDLVALDINSDMGKKKLARAIEDTKDAFFHNIMEIKILLRNYSNEELYAKDEEDFRYKCKKVGQYWGQEVILYNEDGSPLRTTEEIDWYFQEAKDNLKDNEKIWIIDVYVKY